MANRVSFFAIVLSCFLSYKASGQKLKIPQFDFETELIYDKDSVDVINTFFEDVSFISLAQIKSTYDEEWDHWSQSSILKYNLLGEFVNIDSSGILESNVLKNDDTQELLSIIFSFKNNRVSDYLAECYVPRHIILFQNKKRKTIGAIEICFECNRIKTGGLEIGFDKFVVDRFKDFFKKMGLIED